MLLKETLNLYEYPYEIKEINGNLNCILKLPEINENELPSVSILTPTYNRKIFKNLMLRNWEIIEYPRNKLEWIIVDDSDNGLEHNSNDFNLDNVRYIKIPKKLTIGKKEIS